MQKHDEWFFRGYTAGVTARQQMQASAEALPAFDAWLAATQTTHVSRQRWEQFMAGWQAGLSVALSGIEVVPHRRDS
jgi:hypothetical protein